MGGATPTYYVDPAGSDSNNGTSVSTPWATVAKVVSSTFLPGDQVLFKRGGTWRVASELAVPSSGTADKPLVVGAYGSGGSLPIISGGVLVTGWSSAGGTAGTYSASLATAPRYALADAQPLTLGASATTLLTNEFFWSSGTLYINLGGGSPSTVSVEVSQQNTVVSAANKSYITFQDIEMRFASNQALRFDNCTNIVVRRCAFKYVCIQAVGSGENSGTILIQNSNTVRVTESDFKYLQNDGIWVHNTPNIEIDHNTMSHIGDLAGDLQSDGIQFENTYGTAPNSDNAWIHHNKIQIGPQSPKGCILVSIDSGIAGASSSAVVEYNILDGGNFGVGVHASNVTVRYNACLNQRGNFGGGFHVDSAGTFTGMEIVYNLVYNSLLHGIIIQDSANNRQVTIANNTFVDCGRAHMYLGAPIYGTVANNICWNTRANPSLRCVYILSVAGGQTLTCDYNLYNTPFTNYLRFGTNEYSTLAAWRSATGYDTHTISADPLFTNADLHDYTLVPSSPAINAGTVVLGIDQYALGTMPDIGYSEGPPSGAAVPSGGRVWFPEDFGATGTGDDISYLNAAIAGMTAGDTLVIRSGKVYRHSAVWDINKPGINIVGEGEIRATAEATSAVWLHADDLYVEDVLFTCPTVTTRGSTLNHHKLILYGGARTRLVRPRVVGSKAAGIFSFGASYYIIREPDVSGTLADGIHSTLASHHGKIIAPRCDSTGDDAISIVSYSADGGICHDIDVYDPKVTNASGGRMFSIVGGNDCHFHNVDGDGSYAAGMYIACENSYLSYGVARCSMRGVIKNANTLGSGMPDHGAIVITIDRAAFTLTDVAVAAEIQDTRAAASRSISVFQYSGTLSNAHIGPIVFRGTKPSTDIGTVGAPTYTLDGTWPAAGGVTAVNTANSGSAITLGAPATYAINDITLNAATPAITLPTALAGQSFTLVLRQDATGGRVPSWVGTVKWPGGASPTLTPAASAVDVVTFVCVVAGTWLGFPAGYDVK